MDRVVDGDTRTKWEIAVAALDTLTTDYQGRLRFGLAMFPDEDGERCDQDGPIYVQVGDDNEGPVMDAVTATQPDGPCVTNIDTAIGQVSADPAFPATADPTRRSFVLLITDGKQSGSCGGIDRDVDTEALIAELAGQGYPTYVVGFGSGVRPASLEMFALAGGVPRAGGVVYYQADTAAELDAAIAAIAGDIGGDPEFGCTGLPCPDGVCLGDGETCESGTCVVHAPDAGPTPDSGADPGDADAGVGPGGAAGGEGSDDASCGCAASSAPSGADLLGVLFVAGILCLRRRRR